MTEMISKRILIVLLLIGGQFAGFSQHKNHHKKVKAYKISFFTEELDLSIEEAEKFWPLFRIYENKRDSLHRTYYKKHKMLQDSLSLMTEQEAQLLLDQQNEKEIQFLLQKKEMMKQFTSIIGAKKTVQLQHLEHRFRQRLIKKMRKEKEEEEEEEEEEE